MHKRSLFVFKTESFAVRFTLHPQAPFQDGLVLPKIDTH